MKKTPKNFYCLTNFWGLSQELEAYELSKLTKPLPSPMMTGPGQRLCLPDLDVNLWTKLDLRLLSVWGKEV